MDYKKNMLPPIKRFSFTLSEGNAVLILKMNGNFSFDFLTEIQTISKELPKFNSSKFMVLDLTELVDVETKMIFTFAKIQQDVRRLGLQLRVCALSPKLEKKLYERGVIRDGEIYQSLTLAIRSLLSKSNGVAA